jgi:hypothetical protein
MSVLYILDSERNVIPCNDAFVWGAFMEEPIENRRVGLDFVGDKQISTVFLGIDYSLSAIFLGIGDFSSIQLFETMIFSREGPLIVEYPKRYSTWQQALDGHNRLVEKLKGATMKCYFISKYIDKTEVSDLDLLAVPHLYDTEADAQKDLNLYNDKEEYKIFEVIIHAL